MPKLRTVQACSDEIAAIGVIDRELGQVQAELDGEVAAAKARYEARAAPLRQDRLVAVERVRAFCESRRPELTEGKRQSIEFSSGLAGWRRGQDGLEVDPTLEEKIIARLNAPATVHLLRFYEPDIDKRAILKEPALIRGIKGLRILPAQESFFVKPVALDLAEGPGAQSAAAVG